MARLSASVLRDLGVDPVYVPVELPLYSRFRHETVFVSGVPRTRSVLQDLSKQELTAVVLQLTDFRHFRRYVLGLDKMKRRLANHIIWTRILLSNFNYHILTFYSFVLKLLRSIHCIILKRQTKYFNWTIKVRVCLSLRTEIPWTILTLKNTLGHVRPTPTTLAPWTTSIVALCLITEAGLNYIEIVD